MNLLEDGNALFLVFSLPISVSSSPAQLWHIPGSDWSICLLGTGKQSLDTDPGPACCSLAHKCRETGDGQQTGRSLGRDLGKAWVVDAGETSAEGYRFPSVSWSCHHEQPNKHPSNTPNAQNCPVYLHPPPRPTR